MSHVDLRRCCNEALAALSGEIEIKASDIVIDALPSIMGDGAQIRSLFQHLLSNALKNQRSGVASFIHVSSERRDGAWVIGVHDNGIGIRPTDISRLFIAFQHVQGGKSNDGLGLGLAICRSVVEHHGGKIWAESILGHGSSFYFSLPDIASDQSRAAQ